MLDLHGLIYAYHSSPSLGDLVKPRTSASLPFCSRYRLIDFALSSMTNAGVRDVGVVMQHDYQSLLDHIGSGKDWDLSRLSGGLRLLPPFGLQDNRSDKFCGSLEALAAIKTYIVNIKQNHVVLFRGDIAANIDLKTVFEAHLNSGYAITAICSENTAKSVGDVFFVRNTPDTANQLLFAAPTGIDALTSAEIYIINKGLLLDLIEWSLANNKKHFHRDALSHYIQEGGTIGLFCHNGYISHISTVFDYYSANLDMLNQEYRNDLFSTNRPIYTKGRSSVSSYYGEDSSVNNSLVADGCFIEGELTNCILFRGVRIRKGAKLKNCVIMQDCIVGDDASLNYVISDKYTIFSNGLVLSGSHALPMTVPKCRIL